METKTIRKRVLSSIIIIGMVAGMFLVGRAYNLDRVMECLPGAWAENDRAWTRFRFKRDMTAEHLTDKNEIHRGKFSMVVSDQGKLGFALSDEMGIWYCLYQIEYINQNWLAYRAVDENGEMGEVQWLFKRLADKWYIDPELAVSNGEEWELEDPTHEGLFGDNEKLEFMQEMHSGEYWFIAAYTTQQEGDPRPVIPRRPWYGSVIIKDGTIRIYENPWRWKNYRYDIDDEKLVLMDSTGRKVVYKKRTRG